MVNKKIVFAFLILLITAISLSPRFSLGFISGTERSIDIRVEDIILCFGLVVWFFYILISGKYKFKLPPLFWPITSICTLGFLSVLMNLLIGSIALELTFFYFLKEIEFFLLYFFTFYCIDALRCNKQLIKYWIFFALLNIFWIFYVFIFSIGITGGSYGPSIFIEPGGPFPSGGFLLMLFIFFLNLFVFYYNKLELSKIKKLFIFIICSLPILGIISSGSMASTIGLLLSLIISLFLLFKGKMNLSRFIKLSIFLIIIIGLLLVLIYALPVTKRIISLEKIKWEYMSGSPGSRGGNAINNLTIILEHPEKLIIGKGVYGEAHSQYVRVLLERGIIGMLLFFWLMYSILKISYNGFKEKNDYLKKGLSAGLFVATIAMLVMAIPNDVFMVVKPDEVYWFFAAMTMVAIAAPKKIIETNN